MILEETFCLILKATDMCLFCFLFLAQPMYTDENTQQSQPDSLCSDQVSNMNEDSYQSFPDNSNTAFSQSQDTDSNQTDMRIGEH